MHIIPAAVGDSRESHAVDGPQGRGGGVFYEYEYATVGKALHQGVYVTFNFKGGENQRMPCPSPRRCVWWHWREMCPAMRL